MVQMTMSLKICKVILDGIVQNIFTMMKEQAIFEIDSYDINSQGYSIVQFLSLPYTLHERSIVYGIFLNGSELVCDGKYFSPVNMY